MKIAILGSAGVPGNYGGFETLAENLVRHHAGSGRPAALTVYCSAVGAPAGPARLARFETAELRYLPLDANGIQSIAYDALSLADAVWRGHDRLLLLGVSGALALPFIRLVSHARIVTNIDGVEWRRDKWNWLARLVLRASEWAAVRFSHSVIADNAAIGDYVRKRYGRGCAVVAYGGDHSQVVEPDPSLSSDLPPSYALALCRIEPENNVHTILEAWLDLEMPLVFVGNWERSAYGRDLKARFGKQKGIHLLDPVYEPAILRAIRDRARIYVHGHSAGGTNPSLVEMMHFGVPVLAHGCVFNRNTTDGRARYFETAQELKTALADLSPEDEAEVGAAMSEIAKARYTWDQIGWQYFELLERPGEDRNGRNARLAEAESTAVR